MLDADYAADMFDLTQRITAARGLPAYEVSNHAVPGAECQHNLVYWRYGDYIGVGPGAHGRLTLANGQRLGTSTEKHPETWMQRVRETGSGIIETEDLSAEEQSDELLLMGLRLREGIDVPRYEALADRAFDTQRLQGLMDAELVEWIGNSRLRATPKGVGVLNSVIAELVS